MPQFPSDASIPCRLCQGNSKFAFNITLLKKHDVAYFQCEVCKALETEPPYWLGEAYQSSLSNLDTGAAQRNSSNLAMCFALAKLTGAKNIVDIGGGDGLLCRMLRDYGFNAYVKDKYAKPLYAQGYTEPDFEVPDLITAFEVFEHFENPMLDIEEIFKNRPKTIFISTGTYANQKPGWWYFSVESGQHIFFYSKEAFEHIARKYGYACVLRGGYAVFVKNGALSAPRMALVRVFLHNKVVRLMRAVIAVLPAHGVQKDYQQQAAKVAAS